MEVSEENTEIVIHFSEKVNLLCSFSQDKMELSITGPESSYDFDWEIDTRNTGDSFTSFQVNITSIRTSLQGDAQETMVVRLFEPHCFADSNGNKLEATEIHEYLHGVQTVTIEEKATSKSSGTSVQFLFVGLLVFNFCFHFLFESSLKFLWGLTHLMQLFRVIVLINVAQPKIITLLLSYFRIAAGEIELLERYIPAFFSDAFLNQSDFEQSSKLKQQFSKYYLMNFPYFLLEFERSLIVFTGLFLVGFIALFVLKTISGRFKRTFDSLFFNIPLRGLTEWFVDMCLICMINISVISYKTRT